MNTDVVARTSPHAGTANGGGYPTLMVHLDMGPTHAGLLNVAADLAGRFGSGVIGMAACQPLEITADAYGFGDIIQQDRDDIELCIQASEAEFRHALHNRVARLDWRSIVTTRPLPDAIAREARSADLLITGLGPGPAPEGNRSVDIGALVMQAGRPILIIPKAADAARLDRVVIGWNDTSEVRRAVADALPILSEASHVCVAAIVAEADIGDARAQVSDVMLWLGHHGIAATTVVSPSSGDDATRLASIADDEGADLIVAGAFGHSRMREWAMGGVTRDLLLHAKRCSFLSH